MKSIRRSIFFLVILTALSLSALAPAQSTDADAAKAQALNLFKIYRARDWKGLYDNVAFSPAVTKTLSNRDDFASAFDKGLKAGDPNNDFGKLMDNMSDISVGFAVIEGDKAYVATSCTISVDAQKVKFLGIAKLIKVGDAWKWDLTFTDDSEKATELRFTQIIGDPAKSS